MLLQVAAGGSVLRPAWYLFPDTGGNRCQAWFLPIHAPNVPKSPICQSPYQSAYWHVVLFLKGIYRTKKHCKIGTSIKNISITKEQPKLTGCPFVISLRILYLFDFHLFSYPFLSQPFCICLLLLFRNFNHCFLVNPLKCLCSNGFAFQLFGFYCYGF